MGSIRPNLPDISHLPPPGLREIYWALSSGSLGLGVHLREQPRFASLERKFEDNGLPGKHALGWYMYWLKTCRAHCRNSANVLTMWTLMSGRMSDAFLDSFPKYPTAAYEGVLSVSSAGYWQNAPLILRYVLLLSACRQDADRLRGERLPGMMAEYVGLPYVRTVLPPDVETGFWTLAVSLSASCTQL